MRRLFFVSTVVLALIMIAASILSSSVGAGLTPPQLAPVQERTSTRLAPAATTITTDTITIPTYPYASHLFTATNALYNISYPVLNWAQYEGSHPHPIDKTYTRLTLENDWLRVSLLPELGGRVYEMIYKPTGNNELYRNLVIKPTHWGPPEQGWWLAAGGIEWGLPVEEHGYESAIPWAYEIITGTAGVTVTVRDSTAPDRLRAAVSIFLPNDRAVLIVRPRIENDRNVALNFKWWDNAMLAPGPGNSVGKYASNPNGTDLKFVFPETQVTVHSTGDPSLPGEGQPMSWPIYKNRDMSRLQSWNQWLGFFARPGASQDWVSVYDLAHQEGVVRIFPHTIAQGTKGFAMGWRDPIGAGEWTDDDSYYAELHGGLASTFWDSASIGAHQAIEWDETWYPVAGLNGLTTGNAEAALHIAHTGPTEFNIDAGAFTNRPLHNARFAVYLRTNTCDLMGERVTDLMTPATPLTLSLENIAPVENLTAMLTENDQFVATHHFTNNGHPPTTSMLPLPTYVTQTTFPIDLGASAENCLRSMDVQVRDGWDGQWTDWITGTMQSTHWFTGENGHTYYFRVRALDWAGNQSAYTTNPFGNAFTSVLLTPAPVLDTSVKGVDSPFILWSPIGWSIDLWNTGNLSTTATITDTLPISLTVLTDTVHLNGSPMPDLLDNGTIRWTGNVAAGEHIDITFQVSVTSTLSPGDVLTNTVWIDDGTRAFERHAISVQPYRVFLPIGLR